MKKQFYILSLALAGIFGQANAQCGWIPVGPNDSNRIAFGETKYDAVTVDLSTNNTLVVYRDGDAAPNYYGGSVAMYNNTSGQWSQLGMPAFSAGEIYSAAICVDHKHGIPWVAFEDKGVLNHCSVWEYSSGVWDTLPGQNKGLIDPCAWVSIATDKNGVPYVAYEDLVKSLKLDVMMYNGTTWVPVGGSLGISGGQVQYVSLAFDTVNNIPYVAYEDGSDSDRLMVLSYNGTSWATVGGATYAKGISLDTVNFVSLAVDANGHPFVGFEDFSKTYAYQRLNVMMFNGTTWVADSSNSGANLGAPITYPSIGVDASDNVYAAYTDGSYYGYGGLSMAEFKAGSWNYVKSYKVSQDISSKASLYVGLALDNTGTPVVAYEDKGVGDHAEAFKWNSTNSVWNLLGSLGLSNGSNAASGHNGLASYTSIAISPAGVPYIAYVDGNNSTKATVMNYTSGSWNVVGTAGLSVKTAKFTNMGFDKAGEPVVMFSDDGAAPKYSITALKYNGTSWTAIGTNSNTLSGTYAYDVSMAVSANDSVYACFENSNYHMSVMACPSTGSTWNFVGASDVTGDSASSQSIAIDKNGVPYIAFQDDAAHSLALSVMKYSGGSWQYVGSRAITGTGAAAEAAEISIQIDPTNNMPVVAYSAYNTSTNENCVRFNGTTWTPVGNPNGFSNDWTAATSLSINNAGTYFVTYSDWGNEVLPTKGYQGQQNVTVEEFNPAFDTAWRSLPPFGAASFNGSDYEASAINPATGALYVAYTSYGAFVKELDCPTGINEIKGSDYNGKASVYPNPSRGSFTIELQNASPKSRVAIYNVLGENVYESNLTSDKTQINLINQAPGIYLYRILSEEGQVISTGKLIIQ
ncbi:MAG TPA: T9SS type A sorting domain-containing protein [Bacteroidia bacterium]|jgi:hypothetical protein|nr:T9SS type A sorting domain-containing protein [Bacteroidia bacterium]